MHNRGAHAHQPRAEPEFALQSGQYSIPAFWVSAQNPVIHFDAFYAGDRLNC